MTRSSRISLLAQLFFLTSLLLLRHQIVVDLKLSYEQAIRSGIVIGWISDIAMSLLPMGFAGITAAIARAPVTAVWSVSAAVLWIATFANTIYFRFFHAPLPWWTVKLHLADIAVTQGSAGSLGATWPLISSLILLAGSIVLRLRAGKIPPASKHGRFRARLRHLSAGLAVLVLALLVRQSPVWFGIVQVGEQHRGNILTNQVIVNWWEDWTHLSTGPAGADQDREIRRDLALVQAFRDYKESAGVPDTIRPSSQEWPLARRLEVTPERTRQLRARLGLPLDGPINVLVLFLETTRQFEIGHPRIGPRIFPRLRSVLEKKAIQFTQAYSSSLTAGQTVRGQFSTLCSMIPTIHGPAEYLAHYTVRLQCLQSYFRDHGYGTAWINSFESTFHNKGMFESLHGMERFFDGDYFRSKGIARKVGDWGLADGPVLRESVNLLNSLAAESKPFFAHLLTISTHHPHSMVPEAPLPEDLAKETAEFPEYQAYLSTLRYLDESLGEFFDEFFATPAARDTLVVLLGDHSTPVSTHIPLTQAQAMELRFRIPLALITGSMLKAERIDTPVHQADVAPTIAEIAGLSGNVTWIGSGLFSPEGRPFVFAAGEHLQYRTKSRGCYTGESVESLSCLRIPKNRDPLFDSDLATVPEDPGTTEFFREVIRANDRVIAANRIAPAEFTTEPVAHSAASCIPDQQKVTSACTTQGEHP